MFFSMEDFLQQLSEKSEKMETSLSIEQPEPVPLDAAGIPVDLDGDSVADGWGFDRDGDGKIDVVQYDFNHDGAVDAIGIDTTGDGVIDTIYYDFDHDGIMDATAFDSTGDGIIDTMTFGENGIKVFSDVGFTVSSAWEAGVARAGFMGMDGGNMIPNQSSQLGLSDAESNWAEKAIDEETMTSKMARKEISFGASTTCIGGKTGCTGCAGILIDRKIGCQSGACTGGTRIPK